MKRPRQHPVIYLVLGIGIQFRQKSRVAPVRLTNHGLHLNKYTDTVMIKMSLISTEKRSIFVYFTYNMFSRLIAFE